MLYPQTLLFSPSPSSLAVPAELVFFLRRREAGCVRGAGVVAAGRAGWWVVAKKGDGLEIMHLADHSHEYIRMINNIRALSKTRLLLHIQYNCEEEMIDIRKRTLSSRPFQHADYLNDDYSCNGPAFKSFEQYSCSFSEAIDTLKRHTKKLVRFVCDLHKEGLSLDSLDESNIVYYHNELKLRRLYFVEGACVEDRMRDFKLLHILLMKLLDTNEYKHFKHYILVSEYMGGLLHILEECSEYDENASAFDFLDLEHRLANHWSLLSVYSQLTVIKNFIDKESDVEKRGDYDNAVNEMQRRGEYKTGDWTKALRGPALKCFNYQPPPYKSAYVGAGKDEDVNWHILRFSRNMATHLERHIPRKRKEDSEFNMEIEKYEIIMGIFGDELLSFYEKTFEYGIADKFIPPGDYYEMQQHRTNTNKPRRWRGRTTNHEDGGGEQDLKVDPAVSSGGIKLVLADSGGFHLKF